MDYIKSGISLQANQYQQPLNIPKSVSRYHKNLEIVILNGKIKEKHINYYNKKI